MPGPEGLLNSFEFFFLVTDGKRNNNFVKFTVHNSFQFIKGKIYAVIGEPALGKIVGSDPLASIAAAYLTFSILGYLIVLFLFELVQQSGTKNGQGFGFVFVLGFLILADDYQPGGQVGDPYCRVGGVYALPARTG